MENTFTKETVITYRNFDNIRWQVEYLISHGKPARLMNLNTNTITVIPPLYDLDEGTRCYNTYWIKSKGRRFKYTASNFYGREIQLYLKTFDLERGRDRQPILRMASNKFLLECEFDKQILQDTITQYYNILEQIDGAKVLQRITRYNKIYTFYDEDNRKIEPLPMIDPEQSATSFIEFGRHWYTLYDLTRPRNDREAQTCATMICYYLSTGIKPSLTPRQLLYQHVQMEENDPSSVTFFKQCYSN